jgi:radical SAM protein with 4Fe4S-binding SPASM domain
MTAASSKTFCILPWVHFYANPDGSVLPCCIGDHNRPLGNVRNNTIKEIWNNDQFKAMRLKMLNGERCDECSACYHSEDNGIKSARQHQNIEFQDFNKLAYFTNPDGSLDSMDLKYLDIRWSNICNFKCRSCSSTYSSSWATEDNKQGYNKPVFILSGGENNDHLFSQIKPHLANIREFYFAGGEPLLTDKHYEILDYLIEIGNTDVKLRYNTNLSNLYYKDKSVIDYWNQFSRVEVYASLDSWGDRAEYIREGTVWEEIETNVLKIRQEAPAVKLGVSSVVSAFNVATLIPFLDKITDMFGNDLNLNFYNLINPHYYSTSIIPDDLRESIIKKLENTRYTPSINRQLDNVISHLKNNDYSAELRLEFLNVTDHYDEIRNRHFVETFPELAELYS